MRKADVEGSQAEGSQAEEEEEEEEGGVVVADAEAVRPGRRANA